MCVRIFSLFLTEIQSFKNWLARKEEKCVPVKSRTYEARCVNTLAPRHKKQKLPFIKNMSNTIVECSVKKCSALVWKFNFEQHFQQKHSNESVREQLDDIKNRKTDFIKTAKAKLLSAFITVIGLSLIHIWRCRRRG